MVNSPIHILSIDQPTSSELKDAHSAFCEGLISGIAKRVQGDQPINAFAAIKEDGPFYCGECYSEAIVRKCTGDRRDHFAHKARLSPIARRGETELHKQCKTAICKALSEFYPNGNWATERLIKANESLGVPDLIPDISGRINGTPIAIEIQASYLGLRKIIKRTQDYTKRNIAILWIVPLKKDLGTLPFRPRHFERFLHKMYFSRIYYWYSSLEAQIQPVHFKKAYREIEFREWYEPGGELIQVGGYPKAYKAIKSPNYYAPLNIATDFISANANEWKAKNDKITVPSRLIFKDILQPWWDESKSNTESVEVEIYDDEEWFDDYEI